MLVLVLLRCFRLGCLFTSSLVDHCRRCIVTTVCPDRGIYHAEGQPLKTLSKLNTMPNSPAGAFGVNSLLSAGEGETLSVGQRFTLSADS